MNACQLPLVSVAIITYNQKGFLRECIESVLKQDYPNMEIVVADDCSTDGTQAMLREYEARYPRKFVLRLSEKNKGITSNSNLAHFACSGKYIAWMGGDDLMLPGKISRQVKFMMENKNCTISHHNTEVFESDSGRVLHIGQRNPPYEGDVTVAIKYGTFNGACATMVLREKTPEKGFNETLPVASDWLYWVETLHSGGEILFIDEVLGRHRRHADNITNMARVTRKIVQGELDHLNSCNIILQLSPDYFKYSLYRYSHNLYSLRYKINYTRALFISTLLAPNLKKIIKVLVHLITLSACKL